MIIGVSQFIRQRTLNNLLKWIGLICLLGGALSTAFMIDPLNVILFNIGSASYFWWAVRIKDLNLALMNGGLLTIYVVGAIIRLFFS